MPIASVLSLIVLLPLLGACIIGIWGFLDKNFRKSEKLIGSIATLMVAIPFVLVLTAFLNYDGHPRTFGLALGEPLGWMFGGNLDISFQYTLDNLSLTMALIITGVGSLIHIYSVSYMHGDRGFFKFFLYLNLFIFAMLNLVLGSNLPVLFLGWEGVGACSYFLIGFWYEDMSKAAAAQKAFIANRIGDFAMLTAMFILYTSLGTLDLAEIVHRHGEMSADTHFWVALLVFIAATGKSAQIPLFVWLPDAMAGPTPVSALIHAATMVTSGIYLIARMGEIFLAAPAVMTVVCIVGALTAILAALIAIAQNDIKKVLAYSTVSQLGFMFMALGAGAFTTAIFHVMTHAFFKACLFLGSGSVIHAMEHTHAVKDPQDIRTMGGLKKYMPSTRMTFLISTLAIAGVPLLSGFFSKDEILTKVFANAMEHSIYWLPYVVGITTALLTAFYMTRVYYLTFEGAERFPLPKQGHGHDAHGHKDHGNEDKHHAGHDDHGHGGIHAPHENPALMTIPLWILAILAIVGGYVGMPAVVTEHHAFNEWLHPVVNVEHVEHVLHHNVSHGMEWGLIFFSIAIAGLGIGLSYRTYSKNQAKGDAKVKGLFGSLYKVMENKFYIDELYNALIIKPFVFLGKEVIMAFDRFVIDGLVNGIGKSVLLVGDVFRQAQSGFVGHYALILVVGVVAILTYLLYL